MEKRGYLVTIEGIDGSGKSTLARALEKNLCKLNLTVLLTQEPGATTLGAKLRQILHEDKALICDKAEYLLFAANRAQHFEEMVLPALASHKVVISDRMGDSSLAYQGYGRGLDINMIKQINTWAMNDISPDLILYIKLDFKTALSRLMQRGGTFTSFEKEKELFWQRVIHGFETIFKQYNNVIFLDGSMGPDALCEQATKAVINLIKKA